MILSDSDIIEEIEKKGLIIEPFRKKNLGPCSYDLTIGEIYSKWGKCPRGLELIPGVVVGVTTKEKIIIPSESCIAGIVSLRSGPTRKGLFASFSNLVDPGYSGQLTFTLQTTIKPIRIDIGSSLFQILFFRTGKIKNKWRGPEKSFGGTI